MRDVLILLAITLTLAVVALIALLLLNCWSAGGYWIGPFMCWGMG